MSKDTRDQGCKHCGQSSYPSELIRLAFVDTPPTERLKKIGVSHRPPHQGDFFICEKCIRDIKAIPFSHMERDIKAGRRKRVYEKDAEEAKRQYEAQFEGCNDDDLCPKCFGDGKIMSACGWIIDHICKPCGGTGRTPDPDGPPPTTPAVCCCYCGETGKACKCVVKRPAVAGPEESIPF